MTIAIAVAVGFVFAIVVFMGWDALRDAKPRAQSTCGKPIDIANRWEGGPVCSRHEGHSGPHSVKSHGWNLWWEKEQRP